MQFLIEAFRKGSVESTSRCHPGKLSRLPPYSAHPPGPVLDILARQDAIDGIPFSSEDLIARHAMDKTMTSPTQPGNAIQHPLIMPALLEHLCMHLLGNEMMIRERDPVAFADLARLGSSARPDRRRRDNTVDVVRQRLAEELPQV